VSHEGDSEVITIRTFTSVVRRFFRIFKVLKGDLSTALLRHLESELEIMAKSWLKRHFGLEIIKTSFAFSADGRNYEIDLFGSRREGWKNSLHHFAINCITRKAKTADFANFLGALSLIHNAALDGLQEWYADYALIFSNIGFTRNAIAYAKENGLGAYLKVSTDFEELSKPLQLYY
jgi:hypothetical protein